MYLLRETLYNIYRKTVVYKTNLVMMSFLRFVGLRKRFYVADISQKLVHQSKVVVAVLSLTTEIILFISSLPELAVSLQSLLRVISRPAKKSSTRPWALSA